MPRRRSAPIPFWRFITVTLPLALPGIIAGMVLCFAKALGEFGATITFVSNIPGETQTISAAIYTYTQVPGGDAAALRLVMVAIVIALAALLASEWSSRAAPTRACTESDDAVASTWKRISAISLSACRFRKRRPASPRLFGPSGAGKTTLVNMIAGLRNPDRGRIVLDDDSPVRSVGEASTCRLIGAASAMCFRKAGCSRI